jgi:quinone-modifying oxidoreductase subunit QmoC
VKTAMKMAPVGMGMAKTGRMSPMEMVGGHAVKDLKGFHNMIKKAQELEDQRIAQHGA